MSFILKDIYDFVTLKYENEYLFQIKEYKNEYNRIKSKLENPKSFEKIE